MSKSEGKSEIIKPGKQFGKGSSNKPPPVKRTHSDVSPNCSMEEITVLGQQIEGLSEEMKSVREEVKRIMKKDQMEIFIKETVTKIISDLNENIDMMVEIKVEEKTKKMKESLSEVEDENRSLKGDIINLKKEIKSMKLQLKDTEKTANEALAMANYNEQFSRKNNVKFTNIKEKANETEDDLKSTVCNLMKNHGVNVDQTKIQAIHRIPGKKGQQKPILVRLMNNNEKSKIMKKRKELKAAGTPLKDDVTKLNTELIQHLINHNKIESAWFFNGRVFGQSEGKRYKFDIFDDVDAILRQDK